MGGLVPVCHFVGAQRNVVPKGHKITGNGRHKGREQPDQRPHNTYAERRQGIAHPQHQQKFAEEKHTIHGQCADEQIGQLPRRKDLSVAVDAPQHRHTDQLQHRDQQHLRHAKDCLARKQAAAALQSVEQLGGIALYLHIPQPGGQYRHHHRHQNRLDDRQAVEQGTVAVGKLLRVCRGKAAHPQHDNAGNQQAEGKVVPAAGLLQLRKKGCHVTPPPRCFGSG